MAAKRYAEYREIGNPDLAGAYRRSFKYYTEEKLLISCFFYAITSSLFLGVFLIKYRIELILSFPLFAILFSWYLHLAQKSGTSVQAPETMYRERWFMTYLIFLVTTVGLLLFVKIPVLHHLLDVNAY